MSVTSPGLFQWHGPGSLNTFQFRGFQWLEFVGSVLLVEGSALVVP